MTATVEQIAEEALRRYPADYLTTGGSAAKRAAFEAGARWMAEQVAALGVGDGEVEWAIRLTDDIGSDIYGFVGGRRIRSEADASTAAREDWAEGVARPVRRAVGPWVEVTDEGGEGA